MAIIIRKAEKKDIPFIVELLDYIRELHHSGRPDIFKASGTKYTSAELEEKIQREDEAIFVAYDGDKPLGYIFTAIQDYKNQSVLVDKRVLYVDDFCVYNSVRGRGVGRMLMDSAKDYANLMNCNSMELVVWKFENSSEGFYRSYGFTTMSRRMEYKIKEN